MYTARVRMLSIPITASPTIIIVLKPPISVVKLVKPASKHRLPLDKLTFLHPALNSQSASKSCFQHIIQFSLQILT